MSDKTEQLGVGLITRIFGDAASDRRGYARALNDVLRLMEREKNEGYIGAVKHLPGTGGVTWEIREPICFYNSLSAKVRKMMNKGREKNNDTRTPRNQV